MRKKFYVNITGVYLSATLIFTVAPWILIL